MANPRVLKANREQLLMRPYDLDGLLGEEHPARLMWQFLEKLSLKEFYREIRARGSDPGRPAIDPRILLCLWIFATSEGIGSARRISRLCERDDAYRWICGGVSVNHHTLSDFRVEHSKALDDLMTQIIAVLMREALVELGRVAQDGMRVRASAGAASFHRKRTLKECLAAAKRQLAEAKRQADEGEEASAREKAARERAARERTARLEAALAELPKAQAAKRGDEEARVSSTDPEARVMKMGDGGFRPAYNVQFATDTESLVVVGVGVTNIGSDMGQTDAMLKEIDRRTRELPAELLVDGGFAKLESIENAAKQGVTVFAPVPAPREEGIDPHKPKSGDSEPVAAWRKRMGTASAKRVYKERAATAERVNADLRMWRGFNLLNVRGTDKVLSVALLGAITYNVLRWITLCTA